MIAAIYARKSTDQTSLSDEAKSVTRQIEHARAYATAKGWTVDDAHIYTDEGISGAEFERRPGFRRLMNAATQCTSGARAPFQLLVISDVDRLGRDTIETPFAIRKLLEAGVRTFVYLGDRELLNESALDTFRLQAESLGAALEREKARQRTYDAMVRKARAGHVTGGRVFGYNNVDIVSGVDPHGRPIRSHVEREINADEAAVVRRIFELCVKGFGQIAIAKKLNAESAPAPRAQQGRPRAWASSSVREVLYRELYRGVLVWNRSQKRNALGKLDLAARPESEWLKVPVPKLRIVSDVLWQAAHARLADTRNAYLRTTAGKLWGRPLDGAARKYLLTGLARCGQCGGSLEVRSRSHGKQRALFYACSSYWRRGKSVCANRYEIPLKTADAAVIDVLQQELLTPAFVDQVVAKVLTRAIPEGTDLDEARARITPQLAAVNAELGRLVEGLAASGVSSALTAAIKQREVVKAQLEGELANLERRELLSEVETRRLEALARAKAAEWRTLLGRHTPQGRQILAKVLRDKLRFWPEVTEERKGYRFSGEGTIATLLSGTVPELSQAVASLTGFEPVLPP